MYAPPTQVSVIATLAGLVVGVVLLIVGAVFLAKNNSCADEANADCASATSKRKAGTALIVVGVVLIAASLGFAGYSYYASTHATPASYAVLDAGRPQLSAGGDNPQYLNHTPNSLFGGLGGGLATGGARNGYMPVPVPQPTEHFNEIRGAPVAGVYVGYPNSV